MKKLTKREEQIMHVFWKRGKSFIRDIIPELADSGLHYNSVATIIKILEDKGFLSHEKVGNINCYFPIINREEYRKHDVKDIVKKYFDNSYSRMLTYFAQEKKISKKELEEIMDLIKSKNK